LKRVWIADFVAVRRTPGYSAYFETTFDCRVCRCTQCSHAFRLLRSDLGLHLLLLYAGLPGIWLTSKRLGIADSFAIRRVPVHLVYFETILDCRFCRYTRDSGAFGLPRNDLGLQILSLYTELRGSWACFETTLDCRFCRYDSGVFRLLRNDLGL
jgi:hypothetical protein